MLRGFREFIMRGSVVELAVGVVIGTAFTAVVTQFTKSFLEPLIKLTSGGQQLSGTFKVADVTFDWSAFLNQVIAFLLTAATVYFIVVLPMNKFAERRARGQAPKPKAPSEEVRLLTEIRDALLAQGAGRTDQSGHPAPPTATGRVSPQGYYGGTPHE